MAGKKLFASSVAMSLALSLSGAAAGEWTGFYVGAGGGLGIANHELEFSNGPLLPAPPFNVSIDGLGGEGGVFTLSAGGDYQVNQNFVVGAFFDYDWTDIDTSISGAIGGLGSASAEFKVDNAWFIGGRVGYLPTSRTLLFVTAGYTQADLSDLTFNISGGGPGFSGVLASSGDLSGYFIGGGAEVKLTDAISIKGEYRYADYGSEDVTLLPNLAPVVNDFVSTEVSTTIQTARLSLNYRFNHSGGSTETSDAAPADDAASSWTGFYVGAGGGFGMADHELSFSNGPLLPPPPAFDVSLDGLGGEGGLFTLTAGVNYQVNPNFVVGAFVDYDWTDIDTSIGGSIGGLGSASAEFKVENAWYIGGRIGYLPTARTLLFATAGYTQADLSDLTFNITAAGGPSFSGVLASAGDLSGYFIGGGAEIKLTDALSIKGEYRYANYDTEDVTLLPDLAPVVNDFVSTELDTSVQTARISLNYRFDWERPAAEPMK